jgi:hypothetical protein
MLEEAVPTGIGSSAGGPFRPSIVEYIQPIHPWRFDGIPARNLADNRSGALALACPAGIRVSCLSSDCSPDLRRCHDFQLAVLLRSVRLRHRLQTRTETDIALS